MTVELQDEHVNQLGLTPERLRLELAVGLYTAEELTLGQAANIAGLDQTRFLKELGRRGLCIHYDVKEFEEDLKTLESLRR